MRNERERKKKSLILVVRITNKKCFKMNESIKICLLPNLKFRLIEIECIERLPADSFRTTKKNKKQDR